MIPPLLYDASPSVQFLTALDGRRERADGKKISTLKLDADVLVAPADAPCVAVWTKIDALPDETETDQPLPVGGYPLPTFPTQRVTESTTAYSWDVAIESAARRPLKKVKLKASRIESAKTLSALALQLAASDIMLSLSLGGAVKEGGGAVNFMVENVKHNHPLKPLDMAAMYLRAMEPTGVMFEAVLTLSWGTEAPPDAAVKLMLARDNAVDGIKVEAEFGKEAK